jgi:hypothetical protein
MNIALLDISTKKLTWVTDKKWETSAGTFSSDGENYTYTVNEDGLADVYVADLATNHAQKLDLPRGLNTISGHATELRPKAIVWSSRMRLRTFPETTGSTTSQRATLNNLPTRLSVACGLSHSRDPKSSITRPLTGKQFPRSSGFP